MKRIGFLASGRGSNMAAILDACRAGDLDAAPAVLVSNNSACGAMERARADGFPCYHLSSRTHPAPDALDKAVLEALCRHDAELVMLVGYMKKLGPRTLARFRGRILNIHPALLPKFGGEGMYGIHVHAAVIGAGEKETGVTIHLVDAEYDRGPILAQARVPVNEGDTPETLAARVLRTEHSFLVATLRDILSGRITLPAGGQA